ncbi:E3 ubiquitin-protein ligase PRT6-like [Aristolochia californica]|uniref:E3 ubiquitin-protein ligase PRT6-like n=1 Tax=Aristolochia californica TaxID=171875 RepID=UPI0035DAC016
MAGMEVDSPPERNPSSPRDCIVQRLGRCGVPDSYLAELQPGLIKFVKDNKSLIPQVVAAILPNEMDISGAVLDDAKAKSSGFQQGPSVRDHYCESFLWLQWLMFEDEPQSFLQSLAKMGSGHRGVCGAVWGEKDIAYRCRTCEHDPTCAICVTCFQDGNHKDHDYSIMYTGGGCCDCGDVTAWKREGFCSNHRGAEQIRPLSEDISRCMGPILDVFFMCWRDRLLYLEKATKRDDRGLDDSNAHDRLVTSFSPVVIEMLLDFGNCSEGLLSFVSKQVLLSPGLLDVLIKAEQFLHKSVVKKLHELLLKMLGEPIFKYEFAKAFIIYYPVVVNEAIRECSDDVFSEYPLLSAFSVQIYSVPTLTPRLVREVNLLGMLLGCLGELFLSCVGEEGHLQVNRWANLYEITLRIITDIRFVMSHSEVPIYVVHELPEVSRTWMKLLSLVQGMDPQKRVPGLHVEEENENTQTPFVLGRYIGILHSLLVTGAFSATDSDGMKDNAVIFTTNIGESDQSIRHAKVGRLSQESSVSSLTGRSSLQGLASQVPSSVHWLIYECLKAIENWLKISTASGRFLNSFLPGLSRTSTDHKSVLRKSLLKMKRDKSATRAYLASLPSLSGGASRSAASSEVRKNLGRIQNVESEEMAAEMKGNNLTYVTDMDAKNRICDDLTLEIDDAMDVDSLSLLSLRVWPDITYDVSSQDVSFHIPLHRLLSLLLQNVLRRCCEACGLMEMSNSTSNLQLSVQYHNFFGKILPNCHPNGFSAFVMEHPLRLRVFCAQLRAGMWRKNGDPALVSYEWYRSIRWCEQGLEFDLFLLQCCAALGSPDSYVKRIQERFGLSDYLSLNLERPNEYEPVLAQEMLTLIIQIVQERQYCGFSAAENLRRELVCKLAVGDATRSQLVKALPHDLSKNDQLQKTLDTVAAYTNPSGLKQGKYSLRRQYWKELDLYHPRWSSRDLQIAEERYLRFCKVSPSTTQLPQWTKIYYPLHPISTIATSRTVLRILRAVLFYSYCSEHPALSRAPEGVLLSALHLLSLALDICQMQKQTHMDSNNVLCMDNSSHEDPLSFLDYACEEIDVTEYNKANSQSFQKQQCLLSLLVLLMRKYKQVHEWTLVEVNQGNFSLLIENLLKRFNELHTGCMSVLQRVAPDVFGCFSKPVSSTGSQDSVSATDAEERKAKIRERQAAIMEKMKAAQTKFIAGLDSSGNSEWDSSDTNQDVSISDNAVQEESAPLVCSLCRDPDSKNPLSFLTLLQKSRLTTFIDKGPPSWDKSYLERHVSSSNMSLSARETLPSSSEMMSSSQLVHLVQDAVNEFTSDGRPTDIDAFVEFMRARLPAIRNVQHPNISSETENSDPFSPEMMEADIYWSIMSALPDIMLHSDPLEEEKESSVAHFEDSMGIGSVVLEEYVASLSKETARHSLASEAGHSVQSENVSSTLTPASAFDGFGPTDCDGIHISSCGHAVHQECRDRYLSSLRQRFVRRIVFERGSIVDPDQGEFLCPVCRRLANSVLPAVSTGQSKANESFMMPSNDNLTSSACSFSTASVSDCTLQLSLAFSLIRSAANEAGNSKFLKCCSLQSSESIPQPLQSVFHSLCKLYYPESSGSLLAPGCVSPSVHLWDTLIYSLISTEIAARGGGMKMSGRGSDYGLKALYKEVASPAEFILSALLQVAQTSRSHNHLQLLHRFRGIQLFTRSICYGDSVDELLSSPSSRKGNIASILKHVDQGVIFPDIEFWKRAADPVLAHDPFSSLMWVLFCLPCPFLSSVESFRAFVHLFYVVSVIQALITLCLSNSANLSKSGFGHPLTSCISGIIRESTVAKKYFASNYIDSSSFSDLIRRFTHPYLRRCGLFWKLLRSSNVTPFGDSSCLWDWASSHLSDENTDEVLVQLSEVSELEKMFKIPPLDTVIKHEMVQSLSIKWCGHFCKDMGVLNCWRTLYCTPAVPFRLLQLPQLYQDLLQRYIKERCPECNDIPVESALCLLCGKLCSPSWKPCCSDNDSQSHAISCGAGIGVFLSIRRTTILLQRSSRLVSWPSPYLDAFGEEDHEMDRGRPLYLSEERYAALTCMVVSHGLDRSSEVMRQTTFDTMFTA